MRVCLKTMKLFAEKRRLYIGVFVQNNETLFSKPTDTCTYIGVFVQNNETFSKSIDTYYQELMSRPKGGRSVQLRTIAWNGI